jgi:hypothetical protein
LISSQRFIFGNCVAVQNRTDWLRSLEFMRGVNLRSRATTLNRRFEMEILVKPKSSFFALFFAMLAILLMVAPSSHARSGST